MATPVVTVPGSEATANGQATKLINGIAHAAIVPPMAAPAPVPAPMA